MHFQPTFDDLYTIVYHPEFGEGELLEFRDDRLVVKFKRGSVVYGHFSHKGQFLGKPWSFGSLTDQGTDVIAQGEPQLIDLPLSVRPCSLSWEPWPVGIIRIGQLVAFMQGSIPVVAAYFGLDYDDPDNVCVLHGNGEVEEIDADSFRVVGDKCLKELFPYEVGDVLNKFCGDNNANLPWVREKNGIECSKCKGSGFVKVFDNRGYPDHFSCSRCENSGWIDRPSKKKKWIKDPNCPIIKSRREQYFDSYGDGHSDADCGL